MNHAYIYFRVAMWQIDSSNTKYFQYTFEIASIIQQLIPLLINISFCFLFILYNYCAYCPYYNVYCYAIGYVFVEIRGGKYCLIKLCEGE